MRNNTTKVWFEFKFVKNDVWVGVYWRHKWHSTVLVTWKQYDVFICLLPCLPLRITWQTQLCDSEHIVHMSKIKEREARILALNPK